MPPGPWPYYPLTNLQGIDIERIAVLIARVTLWMGHRQMIERFGDAEPVLPLVDLSSIQVADALRVEWPETDAIIGNPPFLGAKYVRQERGDDYTRWLISRYGVGVKDYCVYWFRRSQDQLKAGQRAGLVGTNSITQTSGRSASLDYVVGTGGTITDAVSSQKWPGEAKVHVSLVNWLKGESAESTLLDGVKVAGISSQLRPLLDASNSASVLPQNRSRAFAGVVPQAKGFVIEDAEARSLRAREGNRVVVVPFLTGDDIVNAVDSRPSRWIIDFHSWGLEEANRYPEVLSIVRERVRPEREASPNRAVERRWWLFGRRVEGMRMAIATLSRFVSAGSTGKRFAAAWQPPETVANNAVCVLAFEDDFSMGVLQSRTHVAWAWAQCSTLETRLRYTPTTVFETFPWAGAFAAAEQRDHVAEACRQLLERRSEICRSEQIGLTTLYNQVDEGAYVDLQRLHRTLDEAVAACYGWPKAVAQDDAELVRRLTALNREIVQGRTPYEPFGYLPEARN